MISIPMNNSFYINILRLASTRSTDQQVKRFVVAFVLRPNHQTLCMDNEQQCSRGQHNTSIHVSTPSSTEVLQQKLDEANVRLTSLSLRLASTVDALDTQAKAADRDAALAAEDKHALTRKLAILEAKYLDSEYERQDMQLAVTELMDKST